MARRGAFARIPGKGGLQAYEVIGAGQEAVRQTLYDKLTYASAGQSSLTFFQQPIGQASKTKEDTNMELAGQLPRGKQFIVESIQLYFLPGIDPTIGVTTIAETEFANDVYTFGKQGFLDFFVLAKSQLTEAPLMKFPPQNKMLVDSSHSLEFKQAIAVDAEKQVSTDYASIGGPQYVMNPAILIPETTNFNVSLNWGAAVPLPSGVDGTVFCVLDGILYRRTQ